MTLGDFLQFSPETSFLQCQKSESLLFFCHNRMSNNINRMTIFKIKCKSAYADLSFHIEYIQLFYLKSELQLIFFSDLYPYISQMETTKIDIFYKKKKSKLIDSIAACYLSLIKTYTLAIKLLSYFSAVLYSYSQPNELSDSF